MTPITINSVIQYLDDDGNVSLERVLWFDRGTNRIAVYDLDDKIALPVFKELTEIEYLVDDNLCRLIEYRTPTKMVRDEDISSKERVRLEKAWKVIKDIAGVEPDIYFSETRGKLIKNVMERFSVDKKYVYRKLRAYWKNGKMKNSLLSDLYKSGGKGGERESGNVKRGRPRKYSDPLDGINVTEDIKNAIKKAINSFYKKGLPLNHTYQKMLETSFNVGYEINDNGVKVPIISDISQIPTFGQFRYWYKRLFGTEEISVARLGRRKFDLTKRAVLGESTSEAPAPGSIFQIDATIGDVYLVSRDNRNWIIGRPVVYMVVDVFSRLIVGFYVGLEGPSWLGAMMALYNTARSKVDLCRKYGVNIGENDWSCHNLPDSLIVDRGEMESTKPQNLITNLGVAHKILPPYRADWKGIVEQSFRRENSLMIHWLPGTVTKEYRVRGEKDYRLGALLNLEEFTQILIHSILFFNKSRMDYYERDEQMLADGVQPIPNELWKWGLVNRSGLLKSFPEDVIKLNLMPQEKAKMTYRGLVYKGYNYSSPVAIKNGSFVDARKNGNYGVQICYDPRDMKYVYINNGTTFDKFTMLNNSKTHLFLEEIECYREISKVEEHNDLQTKTQNLAEFHSEKDSVITSAKKESKKGRESDNKRVKNIRARRNTEKEAIRDEQSWELDKTEIVSDAKVLSIVEGADDEAYVAPPNYSHIVEMDFDQEDQK